ncbi:MAG: bifunctional UDP-N-acetylmuramoyl-tripeptide:D-alanyl-D-alanine ligase/alanine racemase [Saprospiraceae bacterium]
MQYQIEQIAAATKGVFLNEKVYEANIEHVLLDSRQVIFPGSSLFVALPGRQFDGHVFLQETYQNGVRNFLVSQKVAWEKFPHANFIFVKNTLSAFQHLAAHHRRSFPLPVIGITGSNGKTIVKEWLFQLLHPDYHIVRSPKSYNSQTGVPLSVLQITTEHTLGIFEAGISQMREMEKLAPVILPDIGIFTNIGEAHSEGFPDAAEKLREKLRLFEKAKTLICCCDDDLVEKVMESWKAENGNPIDLIKWSAQSKPADFQIKKITRSSTNTTIEIQSEPSSSTIHYSSFTIPFTDEASIENAIHCWVLMKQLTLDEMVISQRLAKLEQVAMRLELKEGNNGCMVINDSYNSDLTSLRIALDFLVQQSKTPLRTLILSDLFQTGQTTEKLYHAVAQLLMEKKIDRVIGIGKKIIILNDYLPKKIKKEFYENTTDFLRKKNINDFKNESILIKGARQYEFEKIANRLAKKTHQTTLEINLSALLNNLRVYQSYLKPGTKTMVMVKAGAYGSGSSEVAKLLEFQHIDYLAVAYADEGVELRKAGIQLPILVLNPEEATFESLIRYHLEPEIYSCNLLEKYSQFIQQYYLKNKPLIPNSFHNKSILNKNKITFPIHLKIDSGMHRLGFEEKEIKELIAILNTLNKNKNYTIYIKSIFSHLAGSEAAIHDDFSKKQIAVFQKIYHQLTVHLGYQPISHILNSGGIARFPEHQMGMVRLGIGLYGIDESGLLQDQLQTVNTLKASVSQIKTLAKGQTIGYGRKGIADKKIRIATLSIGYADGLLRRAGNSHYHVLINGQKAPLIGNVCMDMAMVDITHIKNVKEGDLAIIFGKDRQGNQLPVQELARSLDTIPYEIFTSISSRVKRVYVQE